MYSRQGTLNSWLLKVDVFDGRVLLAVFSAVILWVVLTRAVDITGVLASATLPLLAVLAALPFLIR